ncbi:MAG: ABC transporter permease [Candidatus Levybacteria bacterium]|nr:ABC transporter permease [Candidatus Levybacteria bacterium]
MRNRVRSFLTMLGVIIGVSSVILLISLGSGVKTFVTGELEGLGSNLIIVVPGQIDTQQGFASARGGGIGAITSSKLETSDVEQIRQDVSEVSEAVGVILGSSVIKYGDEKKTVQIIGTSSEFADVRNTTLSRGQFFSQADVSSGRKVVVLGANVADDYFSGADPVGEKIDVDTFRYTTIGVLEKKGGLGQSNLDDQVIIPVTAAHRLFDRKYLNFIYIKIVSSDMVETAIPNIKTVLEKQFDEDEFTLVDQKEILKSVSNILNMLTYALSGIAAISLVVGGVGIMNIMLVSVTERTREIGLRKAVGATPRIILMQFLTESVFLSLAGGVIGISIGVLGSLLVGQFMKTTIALWSILLSFAVSAGVGIIFGVMPARKASLLNPIDALRYE